MSLYIASLNSGSNGNCYYVGNGREAVLVDAGISCREIERRMKRLDLAMERVKAVLVSHEHSDHIRGLTTLSKKHRVPVYVTGKTLHGSRMWIDNDVVRLFSPGDELSIGNLRIKTFAKCHDAEEPCSFTIKDNQTIVGVLTDIGNVCGNVVKHFSRCHAAFLESNYDEEMLDKGGYPWHLKQRIRGGDGHLSNTEALGLFKRHRSPALSHLILSHLSENNNCPRLVEDLFAKHANGVQVTVASRYEESEVFYVSAPGVPSRKIGVKASTSQLQFSFA